ncbi:MAG: FKBP-type peptidyl-prolyl cis-trans isomerase [Paludibacter sp.]|nr:FKBP-type peptidyl-prolyl cis-trans isomerase [Paludibacter sp.]
MNRLFPALIAAFAMLFVYSCKSEEYEEWRMVNENWYNQARISFADSIDYKMTSSGLIYKILEPGYQRRPNDNDWVYVTYKRTLINGTTFREDSVWLRQQLDVVAGWREAMKLIEDGGHIQFILPYQIGYGNTDYGLVPPYSTLIYDVKLYRSVN